MVSGRCRGGPPWCWRGQERWPSEHLKLHALSLKHGAELPGPAKESLESGAAGHLGGQEQYWCGLEQSADWKRQAEDGASRYSLQARPLR